MHHHTEKNQTKLTHHEETKKMAHDSQIGRVKEKLKLSHGGPGQKTFDLDLVYMNLVIKYWSVEQNKSEELLTACCVITENKRWKSKSKTQQQF